MIGVRKGIPGIGEDGIQGSLAGDAMIPMPDITTVRVGSYDGFRPVEPYKTDEILPEFGCVLQTLIRMAQEYYLPYPQESCRGHLLLFSNLGEFLRLHVGIIGAFVAVGAHHIYK